MNCPNCGRELADGEVCTCTATPETQPVQEAPAPQEVPYAQPAQPQEAYTAPEAQYQAPQYAPPQGAYFQPNTAPQQPYYQPVQTPPARTDYPEGYHIKRKYVAVLLAATLGVFGIHNFYLGDSNKGVIHILVATLGSILCGLGFVASYVWSVVETVQLLGDYIDRDSNGFKIQTFEEALVKTRMEAESKKED